MILAFFMNFLCFVLQHRNFGHLFISYNSVSFRIEVTLILIIYYCTNFSLNVS